MRLQSPFWLPWQPHFPHWRVNTGFFLNVVITHILFIHIFLGPMLSYLGLPTTLQWLVCKQEY